jgi:hypothetical protein
MSEPPGTQPVATTRTSARIRSKTANARPAVVRKGNGAEKLVDEGKLCNFEDWQA